MNSAQCGRGKAHARNTALAVRGPEGKFGWNRAEPEPVQALRGAALFGGEASPQDPCASIALGS